MPIASDNTLGNVLDLYTKSKGSTTTTSGNISQAGVDSMIQQILGSTQGLAAVTGQQKVAGLYNSSTNKLLSNDLITSAAGKVAALQAGTTQKTSSKISRTDALTGVGLLAAKSFLGPTIKGVGKKFGIGNSNKSIGDSIADTLGLGDSAGGVTGASYAGSAAVDPSDFAAMDFVGSDVGSDLASGTFTDLISDAGSDAASDVVSDAGSSLVGDVAEEGAGDFLGGIFG